MDTIPTEILEHIIDSLAELHEWYKSPVQRIYHKAKFAQYASISQAWRDSIEQITFRDLTITTNELNTFASLFSGENIIRRAQLTSLTVNFVLPSPRNALGCCVAVRIPEREADSIVFSASLAKVFTILADIATRTSEQSPLALSFIEAQRPGQYWKSKYIEWTKCEPRNHTERQMLEAKAVSGYYELVCGEAIPALHGVATLEFKDHNELGDLKPTWLPVLVDRLTDLEELLLRTEDVYEAGRCQRFAQRECLAKSICSLAGNNLRKVRLDVYHAEMRNENSPVHKYIDVGQWSQDAWFYILNHLASFRNLAVLQLLGGLVICPQFFRCILDHPGTPFPSLVEFELQFAVETADGRWYYERDNEAIKRSRKDPEYEETWEEIGYQRDNYRRERSRANSIGGQLDTDACVIVFEDGPTYTDVVRPDRFRSAPDATTFLPFLMDASKAVARLPSLQKFILKLGHWFAKHSDLTYFPIVSRVFELWYLKAGMHRSPKNTLSNYYPEVPGDAAYINQNRLYWRVDGWKPWDEVQAAWDVIAGPDAKVVFLDEDEWACNNNLMLHVYKGIF